MDFGIPPYLPCHSQYTLNVFPRFKISISILHLWLSLMVMSCLWHFFASPQKLQTHHMVSCLISSHDPPVFHLPWLQTSTMWEISEICPVWVPAWNIALSPVKQGSFVLAPRKQIPEEFVLGMLTSC